MKFRTTKKLSKRILEVNEISLVVRNLHVSYGKIRALKGISVEVHSSQVVAIIGANGAGKTTLLKAISGLVKPKEGSIMFCNYPITGIAPEKIARLGLIHVPEGRQILNTMTVRENLELGTLGLRDRKEADNKFKGVFQYFPLLATRLNQNAGSLSGGEQQMLAIGRALMGDPRLLVMDEPSLGLAPLLVNEIFKIIEALRNSKKTILLVEQNAKKALMASDLCYVLENGRIIASGTSSRMINDAKIKAAYLGG